MRLPYDGGVEVGEQADGALPRRRQGGKGRHRRRHQIGRHRKLHRLAPRLQGDGRTAQARRDVDAGEVLRQEEQEQGILAERYLIHEVSFPSIDSI